MNRSRDFQGHLLPELSALQHERAPRPLPLFLELVRQTAEHDPKVARAALTGLAQYEAAPRASSRPVRPAVASAGGATLRDHGGTGPPTVLVPSLINPPTVLDLDSETSLCAAVAGMGRRALLLDWGAAQSRSELDVAGHVETLLAPLLRSLDEPPALIGYCLGGTVAIAAANLHPCERLVTIAAPWRFSGYPEAGRASLAATWERSRSAAQSLGVLPMEVLQSAFWSLDPERTVHKFARFAELPPGGPEARRFVAIEDWANEGEPLPCPSARELIEDLFGKDLPGAGAWTVAGRPISAQVDVPALHLLAARDRIAPVETAPPGRSVSIAAGHVGMVVGSARSELHRALAAFFA